MKNYKSRLRPLLLLIIVSCLFFTTNAQKRRTIQIDSDVDTPPNAGMYGIGVKNKQPYLITQEGPEKQFVMLNTYIPVTWVGVDTSTISLSDTSQIIVLGGGKSRKINLPAIDSLDDFVLNIYYMGLRGGDSTGYFNEDTTKVLYDTTGFKLDSLTSDTIWLWRSFNNKITFDKPIYNGLSIIGKTEFSDKPTGEHYWLSQGTLIALYHRRGKWYLSSNEIAKNY